MVQTTTIQSTQFSHGLIDKIESSKITDKRLEHPISTNEIHFNNGNKYIGDIEDGTIKGKGMYVWKDGTLYKGEFINNRIQGHGEYIWSDGHVYQGNLAKGIRNGFGTMNYPNGAVYNGEWKNGKFHGYVWMHLIVDFREH
jgi:hypothetical protein